MQFITKVPERQPHEAEPASTLRYQRGHERVLADVQERGKGQRDHLMYVCQLVRRGFVCVVWIPGTGNKR